jgi:dihydrofolate reductase
VGAIRVHEFASLDGVIDNPSWTFDFGFDPRMGEAIGGAMSRCDGILLGRKTYEMFEPAWSVRTAEDDPGASFMNDTTKYVVSSTIKTPNWRNSELLGPYDADRIRALKESKIGGLYVSGSGTLVHALMADGLVDELHLFLFPATRGGGPRLFTETTGAVRWTLADSVTYDNGVVYLQYALDDS